MSNSLSHHISTLLRRHDCVIVPGIGAFVCTRETSVFANELLTPPGKRISFNSALIHDDGLLANSYARRMKISFEQARERVNAEASLLQRRLKSEGAVEIARVGVLHRRSSDRLEFIPETAWTLPLPAIKATEAAPAFEVVSPSPAAPNTAVAIVKVPLRLRWLRAAAAAAVLLVLGFALSTPINLQQAQTASLATPQFTPPEAPVFEPLDSPTGLQLNMAMAPADGEITRRNTPSASAQYVIVVGSLQSHAKAMQFIEQTGVEGLQILQSGDKFRVYAAEGATPEAARAAANASMPGFASRFPDSWVCRR